MKVFKVEIVHNTDEEYNPEEITLTDDAQESLKKTMEFCKSKAITPHNIRESKLPESWKRDYFAQKLLKPEQISRDELNTAVDVVVNDFAHGAISTKGKGYNKYILLILLENETYLIHATKLESIGTQKKERTAKLFNRLVDPDNILRYIHILKEKSENIQVFAWERGKESKTFTQFVGFELDNYEELGNIIFFLKDKKSGLEGLKYETSPEELYHNLVKGVLKLKTISNIFNMNGAEYEVTKVVSKSSLRYDELRNLTELYEKLLYSHVGVTSFLKEKLSKHKIALTIANTDLDKEKSVILAGTEYNKIIEGTENKVLILCGYKDAYKQLRYDRAFLVNFFKSIESNIKTGQKIYLLHLLDEATLEAPTNLDSFIIFNKIKSDNESNLRKTLDLFSNLIKTGKYNHDFLKDILCLLYLDTIEQMWSGTNISFFFNSMKKIILQDMTPLTSQFYDLEDGIIEYKSGQCWKKRIQENVSYLTNVIKTKSKQNYPLIILIGVDEKTRDLILIDYQNDDTLTTIKKEVNIELAKLQQSNIIKEIYPIKNNNKQLLIIHCDKNE